MGDSTRFSHISGSLYMPLSTDRKKQFRSIAHALNPIVTIAGNGLNDGVRAELERALDDHELIKIKIAIADREIRKEVITEMCTSCRAEMVQQIGKVAVIYRESKQQPAPRNSNVR